MCVKRQPPCACPMPGASCVTRGRAPALSGQRSISPSALTRAPPFLAAFTLAFFLFPSLLTTGACVLSHFRHVRLFVTPWTIARQAPLSMGFSRQEYWSRWPFPPAGDLPNRGIKATPPALQADSLPLSHWGMPPVHLPRS